MFELLMKIVLDGLVHNSDEEFVSAAMKHCTFRSQLAASDKAWCSYSFQHHVFSFFRFTL